MLVPSLTLLAVLLFVLLAVPVTRAVLRRVRAALSPQAPVDWVAASVTVCLAGAGASLSLFAAVPYLPGRPVLTVAAVASFAAAAWWSRLVRDPARR